MSMSQQTARSTRTDTLFHYTTLFRSSAAANGVIMITTKKGKEGRIDINVSSNVTFERPLLTPKIQNIYGANVNLIANTLSVESWGKKLSDMTQQELSYENTKLRNTGNDDVKDFFRTGTTFNNAVSISGGTELIRSYFSYSNSHANGMIQRNKYNRNTVSFRQSYSLFKIGRASCRERVCQYV